MAAKPANCSAYSSLAFVSISLSTADSAIIISLQKINIPEYEIWGIELSLTLLAINLIIRKLVATNGHSLIKSQLLASAQRCSLKALKVSRSLESSAEFTQRQSLGQIRENSNVLAQSMIIDNDTVRLIEPLQLERRPKVNYG